MLREYAWVSVWNLWTRKLLYWISHGEGSSFQFTESLLRCLPGLRAVAFDYLADAFFQYQPFSIFHLVPLTPVAMTLFLPPLLYLYHGSENGARKGTVIYPAGTPS